MMGMGRRGGGEDGVLGDWCKEGRGRGGGQRAAVKRKAKKTT